jgi:hypothetical protein
MIATMSAEPALRGVDPFYLAHCRFRRRRYDECIAVCTKLLTDNPYDKAVWLLKCQAFAARGYVDDTELEEQGIADMLFDDNKLASVARPGTSLSGLSRLPEESSLIMPNQSVRPVSSATGRPLTGFMRPGTKQLMPKTPGGSLQEAFKVRAFLFHACPLHIFTNQHAHMHRIQHTHAKYEQKYCYWMYGYSYIWSFLSKKHAHIKILYVIQIHLSLHRHK